MIIQEFVLLREMQCGMSEFDHRIFVQHIDITKFFLRTCIGIPADVVSKFIS